MPMRRRIAILLLLFPSSAFAWNAKGHRIIAGVAERRLSESSPDSLKQALELLGEQHLADVGMVAEDLATKMGTTPTAAWHFVNIPLRDTDYKAERDCPFPGCLVDAVTLFRRRVSDPKLDQLQRKEALIYLVHLIGDIYQGWHCASGTLSDGSSDENGTRIHVTYRGGHLPGNDTGDPKNDNVHFLWDVSLLEFEGRDEAGMIRHLLDPDETLDHRNPDTILTALTQKMAEETHTVAQDAKGSEEQNLTHKDLQENATAMDEELLQAGLNLARILKFAFPPR
jgi:hypothetical protein